jgi:hypothetical protein
MATLALLLLPAPCLHAQAPAQLPQLNDRQRENVRNVIRNLRSLLDNSEVKKVTLPPDSRDAYNNPVSPDTAKVIEAYRQVADNLQRKLDGNHIHPVDGLDNDHEKRYVEGEPNGKNGSATHAAYCVTGTHVKIGNDWVVCPDGDIVIDTGYIDPPVNNRQPIDESTDVGFQQKWFLLHSLVHEKWHERMILEQTALTREENKRVWDHLSEDQKKERLATALANATTPEKHVEVYIAQKNILRLELAVLKARRAALIHAGSKDQPALDQTEKRITYINGQIAKLEDSMKGAVNRGGRFSFASCGGILNGTLAMYIVSLYSGYWRLDVDLRNGEIAGVRAPEVFFDGDLYEEDPIPSQPSLYVEMPERIYTGLDVQSQPCEFLDWARQQGYVHDSSDFADIRPTLPGPAKEEETPAQATLVGIILPNDIQQGETISATVTTDTDRYDHIPALHVVKVEVPLTTDIDGNTTLQPVNVRVGSGRPQPAQDGFTTHIPSTAQSVDISLNTGDSITPILDTTVPLIAATVPRKPVTEAKPKDFTTPAVCIPNSVDFVHGTFSGDSRITEMTLDAIPVHIVAETSHAVYWFVPAGITPGAHRLIVRDGSHSAAFQVAALILQLSADLLTLKAGQSTAFHAVVRGLDGLPPTAWIAASRFDLVDESRLESMTPDFHLPAAGEDGELLLTLQNVSRGTITVPGWRNESIALTLHRGDFSAGQYVYTGTIVSRVSGRFAISGIVTPFMAEESGQPVD